jgi:hypothetical protein
MSGATAFRALPDATRFPARGVAASRRSLPQSAGISPSRLCRCR